MEEDVGSKNYVFMWYLIKEPTVGYYRALLPKSSPCKGPLDKPRIHS